MLAVRHVQPFHVDSWLPKDMGSPYVNSKFYNCTYDFLYFVEDAEAGRACGTGLSLLTILSANCA